MEQNKKITKPYQSRIPSTATARVERLRSKFFDYKANHDIERAVHMAEMYRSGVLEEMPRIKQLATLFENHLAKRTIYIEDDQLFAGSFGKKPKAMPIFPESSGVSMIDEYRKSTTRAIDPFEYDEEDRVKLEEVLQEMKHLPSLRIAFYDALTDEEKKFFLKNPEKNYTEITQLCSMDPVINGPGGHITPDFQTVIERGFEAIKKDAQVRLRQAKAEGDQEAIDFLEATSITMDAICMFAERYADHAAEKAKNETDSQHQKELERLADACRHVPRYPARTFFEACQSVWFAYIGIEMEAAQRCYSVGRFDQMTYPLYKADIEAGRITPEEAQEMVDCLFMKYTETNSFNTESFSQTVAGFSPQQQMVAGGQTPDGEDATNAVSYMMVQSGINIRLAQPSISVRLWSGSPHAFIEKACALARIGTGHPSFFNDEVVVPSLVDKGLILEDARDYAVAGCSSVHATRKDKGSNNGGYLNLGASVDLALHNGFWKYGNKQVGPQTGNPKEFTSYEQFEDAVKAQFAEFIRIHASASAKLERIHQQVLPTPFISSFIGDCITRGKDRTNGGAFYNDGFSPRAIGMADVADSLAAVKKLVFEEKRLTMAKLVDAVDANFEGFEEIQTMLIEDAPKYGNDNDYADDLAYMITHFYSEETKKHKALFGGAFHPGFSTVSANVPYGRVVAALPTGRKEWTPLADGVGPCHYVDRHGPTAVVLSSAKLDHKGMSGGSILNLKFSPQTVTGEEGLSNFTAFIKAAIKAGIWHMQFNINDVETLQDAQEHPENYHDLLVRVAGYSALFVALSRPLQDDLIGRTVHTLGGN